MSDKAKTIPSSFFAWREKKKLNDQLVDSFKASVAKDAEEQHFARIVRGLIEQARRNVQLQIIEKFQQSQAN